MQLNFNAFEYDPSQGGAICFPLADYKVEIVAAEPKVVKDNPSAGYLQLDLKVLEGELRGLVQADRLNIFHTNEQPKLIAQRQLSAYCFAINRPYIQDSTQLIGGHCICTIGPQEENSRYSEVKVVKCWDGSLPTRPAQQGQPAAPQAPQAPQAPAPQAGWGPAPAPPAQPPMPPAPPANQQPWGGVPQAAAPPAAPPAPPWGNSAAAPPAQGAPTQAVPPWARQ